MFFDSVLDSRCQMKVFLVVTMLFVCNSFCCAATLSPRHPIFGTWEVIVPGTKCLETYEFKTNGMKTSWSAEEIEESKFIISPKPNALGYYKLTDTVVSSNSKLDCLGDSSPVGDIVTVFVRFEQAASIFFYCPSQTQIGCVGPFKRTTRHPYSGD